MISEKTPKNSVETSDIISQAHEDIPELTNKDEDEQQKNNMEKLISCGFCNRTFYESRLEGHKKICTKEKPFKPLSRKMNKISSCFFQKPCKEFDSELNPEGHAVLSKEKEEIIPVFDEKDAYKDEQILVKCEKCDRKFDSARIDKHAGICKGHKIANPHEETKQNEKKTGELKQRKSLILKSTEENEEKIHEKHTAELINSTLALNNNNTNEKNIKNPLLLMQNYTKKQIENRKKEAENQTKRGSTPKKSNSPRKKENSPAKKKENKALHTENPNAFLTTETLSFSSHHLEDIVDNNLQINLKSTKNINGSPHSSFVNCEFCGKPFVDKNLKTHQKICKNISMKHPETLKPMVDSKKITRKESVLLKNEIAHVNMAANKYNRTYKSFQPAKLYEFKY